MGIEKLDAALLVKYEGRGIAQICANGYTGAADNHCAHFVCHLLGYAFGYTCFNQKGGSEKSAACIRVENLFGKCPRVGKWKDNGGGSCLVFIAAPGDVHLGAKKIDNVPRKHVGIHVNGSIWHYSNSKDKVVKQTVAEFSKHYGSTTAYALFFGAFPEGADPKEP